jgi:hypothetical protein
VADLALEQPFYSLSPDCSTKARHLSELTSPKYIKSNSDGKEIHAYRKNVEGERHFVPVYITQSMTHAEFLFQAVHAHQQKWKRQD